jgi:hypothetical protein
LAGLLDLTIRIHYADFEQDALSIARVQPLAPLTDISLGEVLMLSARGCVSFEKYLR